MLNKWMKDLTLSVQVITGILFTVVLSASLLRIILRNLIGSTWFWIDGFTRMMFIWMVFLGAAALYATNDHLMMPYFLDKMSKKWQRRVHVVINISFFVLAGVLVYYGILVFKVRLRIPYTAWNFPTGYAYLAAPVAGIIMLIFSSYKVWILLKGTQTNSLDTNILQVKKVEGKDEL